MAFETSTPCILYLSQSLPFHWFKRVRYTMCPTHTSTPSTLSLSFRIPYSSDEGKCWYDRIRCTREGCVRPALRVSIWMLLQQSARPEQIYLLGLSETPGTNRFRFRIDTDASGLEATCRSMRQHQAVSPQPLPSLARHPTSSSP